MQAHHKETDNSPSTDLESGIKTGGKQSTDNVASRGSSTETTFGRHRSRPVRVLVRRIAAMTAALAVLVGLGAVVWYFFGWIFLIELVIVALVAYLAAGHWRWFYVALVTAPRDLR